MDAGQYYLMLACIFGFMMAWGVGANDVSNAMGTSVGSKAITIRQAIVIAAVFEFLGSVLSGGEVTNTIKGGLIDPQLFLNEPTVLIYGMLSSLLAAALWLAVASHYGWPVSTTHTIVGAIVGFGAMQLGIDSVHWSTVGNIMLAWVVSPLIGCAFSYVIFMSVQRFIFDHHRPFERAQKVVPVYIFLVGWIVSMITLDAGLPSVGIALSFQLSIFISALIGLAITAVGIFFLRRVQIDEAADHLFHFTSVEKIFSILMIFTACTMAYAHGSNDVANAIGPLAAIVNIVEHGSISTTAPVPIWILLLGASGIVVGLLTYGYRVMSTIGSGITQLTPSRGFAATLATALTVVLASGAGYPISTTHTLVGAIMGIGLARGIGALNLNVVRSIFVSWIITLPIGAILAILSYQVISRVL